MSAFSPMSEAAALIRLQTLPKLGSVGLYKLLAALDVAGMSATDCVNTSSDDLARRLGETWRWLGETLRLQDPAPPMEWASALDVQGWRLIPHTQPDYPASLKRVLGDKCPPLLYVKGHAPLLTARGITFSGARTVSESGLSTAEILAREAVAHNYVVISGHAKGVDHTAHQTALSAGGKTVFIPSEGALRFRLRSDLRRLTDSRPDSWVIATQFAPMDGWHVGHAMQRNRTVIGLSRALFIVEAGLDGGTWDAALEAERLNHPLYVWDNGLPASGNGAILKRGVARPLSPDHFPDLSADDSPPAPHQLSLF